MALDIGALQSGGLDIGALQSAAGGPAEYTIAGSISIGVSFASATVYNRNASIAGSISVGVAIASAMEYTSSAAAYSITGDIPIGVAIASATAYNRNAAISGSIAIGVSISSALEYTQVSARHGLEILVNGTLRDCLIGSANVTRAAGFTNSTATFAVDSAPGDWNILHGHAVIVRDASGTPVYFTGTVVKIGRQLLNLSTVRYTLHCVDYTNLLNVTIVGEDYPLTSPATTDQTIIADLASTYQPSITTGEVDVVANMGAISFDGITLKEAFQRICEQTGADGYVDSAKVLHYYSSASNPAPFSLSDTPDYVTSFPYSRNPTYDSESTMLVNRVIVKGAIDSTTGIAVTATVNDAGSQSTYGVRERLVTDRSLTTAAQCTAFGEAYLDVYALPQESGSITWRYGPRATGDMGDNTLLKTLDVGQLLTIVCASHGINDSFVVRTLSIKPLTGDITEFTATWGSWRPDMTRAIGSRDRTISDIQSYQGSMYTDLVTQIAAAGGHLFFATCLLPGTLVVAEDVLATPVTIKRGVSLTGWGISCRPGEQPTADIAIDVLYWRNSIGEWRSIFYDTASPRNGTPISLDVESPIGTGQNTGNTWQVNHLEAGDRLRWDVLAGAAEDVEAYLKGVYD